MIRVRILCW